MNHIIETERLFLRELTVDDAENFYRLNLNPNVIRSTGDDVFKDVEEARLFLENYNDYKRNGFGRWAVIRKSDNVFLGWCGLKYSNDLDETDIGFRFFEEHWHKGYATESAMACIEYGFQHLGQTFIIGRDMKDNISSIRVLEKIGLTYLKAFDSDGHAGVIYVCRDRDLK
ncbi:MAG: GNAT family N-acetyltransferase [Myroides sp.]|jgi:RimJ/RimL family protein N-acetyltransferase|nr:GNAT family N-acetyltransferase [Myroides sp.]